MHIFFYSVILRLFMMKPINFEVKTLIWSPFKLWRVFRPRLAPRWENESADHFDHCNATLRSIQSASLIGKKICLNQNCAKPLHFYKCYFRQTDVNQIGGEFKTSINTGISRKRHLVL